MEMYFTNKYNGLRSRWFVDSDRPRKKRKKLQRSAPKSLQKEDSDGVWNELAFFKQANRALVAERSVVWRNVCTK